MASLGPNELILHLNQFTHRGRVTHIWFSISTNISSDNALSPVRCQTITWIITCLFLYCELYPSEHTSVKFESKFDLRQRKCISKCRVQNGDHFVSASILRGNTHSICKLTSDISCVLCHDDVHVSTGCCAMRCVRVSLCCPLSA